MDTNTPRHDDDLNAFERRLAGWQPRSEDLNTDAMLFAAGRAASRRGWRHPIWPALCLLLALQSVGLGLWGASQHAECLALASLLRERSLAPSSSPVTAVAVLHETSSTPSPDGYINLRRQMEQDPERWLASLSPRGSQSLEPPHQPEVFRVGQSDRLLAQ
jgi:hypothetical protein